MWGSNRVPSARRWQHWSQIQPVTISKKRDLADPHDLAFIWEKCCHLALRLCLMEHNLQVFAGVVIYKHGLLKVWRWKWISHVDILARQNLNSLADPSTFEFIKAGRIVHLCMQMSEGGINSLTLLRLLSYTFHFITLYMHK